MKITEEMVQIAKDIHQSRMEYIGRSVTSSEINNIDVRVKFDAWMFLKLAELEVRIKQLEKAEIV